MWIIDRFEENMAVIECDEIMFSIPRSALPSDACEGDVISVAVDTAQTMERREKISALMNKLFEK